MTKAQLVAKNTELEKENKKLKNSKIVLENKLGLRNKEISTHTNNIHSLNHDKSMLKKTIENLRKSESRNMININEFIKLSWWTRLFMSREKIYHNLTRLI